MIISHVYSFEFPPASAQIIELHAVVTIFEMLKKNQALICILIAYDLTLHIIKILMA